MKLVRILSVLTVVAGLIAVAIVAAPSVSGQARPAPNPDPQLRFDVFGGGSRIGASVRDLETADRREGGGVYVEDVRPNSPAERAGLKAADVITRFDGETVRSARQFGRLVQETPAGRAVAATVVRDGRPTEMTITPEEGLRGGVYVDGDRFAFNQRRFEDQMDRLRDRFQNIPFNFDFDLDWVGGGRAELGVTVQELTPQLATYFGAKDGVLVASVMEDSAASRAGLKAGDVIQSVNGQNVSSRTDLTRALRGAGTSADVSIGIVRDRKETTMKARLDDVRAQRPRRRQVRPVRTTPA
jgi:C-terminal processing protease CtpA/Prc